MLNGTFAETSIGNPFNDNNVEANKGDKESYDAKTSPWKGINSLIQFNPI